MVLQRISLISSFLASLLLGGYANIDYSDGMIYYLSHYDLHYLVT